MNSAPFLFIRAYQLFVSPFLHQTLIWPSGCRFRPSCSEYGLQAIRQYGLIIGFMLLLGRLSRCHSWSRIGYDPLPKSKIKNPAKGPLRYRESEASEARQRRRNSKFSMLPTARP